MAATTAPPTAPRCLPVVGHALQLARAPLAYLDKLRESGPVVRVRLGRRDFYVLTAPEDVYELLVKKGQVCPRSGIQDQVQLFFGNGILVSEGDKHRGRRRLLQPSLSEKAVTDCLPAMSAIVEARVARWRSGQPMLLGDEFHDLAFAVVTGALFGAELPEQHEEDFRLALTCAVRGIMLRSLTPWPLLVPDKRRFAAAVRTVRDVADALVRHVEQAAGSSGQSELGRLLTSAGEGSGRLLNPTDMREEVISILGAGTETVAVTLAWLFHELHRHPDAQERIVDEIAAWDGVLDSIEPAALPYTLRVLRETLRLHSPNPQLMRRASAATPTAGFVVPAGAEILYSLTTLHRHPDVFPDPLRFDPDRWLPERAPETSRSAYMPFGMGRHRCIGEGFGLAELLVATVSVLSKWRLVPHRDSNPRETVWSTVQPRGLSMVPLPR